MGDSGIVRLATSQSTNKKSKSPVSARQQMQYQCAAGRAPTVHHNHIHEVCCLAYTAACFVSSQLHPSRAHIILRQVWWCCPTPDYCIHGQFWLTLIPVTHMLSCNEAVNTLLIASGVIQESSTSLKAVLDPQGSLRGFQGVPSKKGNHLVSLHFHP